MVKYYLRYLVFLIPALVVSIFYNNDSTASITLQWFCSFFMLIGFGVNTASAAYASPRASMAFILCYTGLNLLIISRFYASQYGTAAYQFLRNYGGALSYVPLEVIVKALLDFNIQQEVVVTLLVAACCLLGYLAGLVRRRVNPDPYRPRIGPA